MRELLPGFGELWKYYAISAKNGIGTVENCPWIRIVVTPRDNSDIIYDIIDPTIIKEVYEEYKLDPFKGMGEVINKWLGINSSSYFKFGDRLDITGKVKLPTDKGSNTEKKKCDILKSIKGKLGDKLEVSVNTEECTHGDNCTGTCPACDTEADKLSAKTLEGNTDKIDNIDTEYWGCEGNYIDREIRDFGESRFEDLGVLDGIDDILGEYCTDPDTEDSLVGEDMLFPDGDDTQSN